MVEKGLDNWLTTNIKNIIVANPQALIWIRGSKSIYAAVGLDWVKSES